MTRIRSVTKVRHLIMAWTAIALTIPGFAAAEEPQVKIGVLDDMSGIYADFGGPSSVLAAKMAAEDFGGQINGRRIEIVSGDHLNKADVGSIIARKWFDQEGVDAILD